MSDWKDALPPEVCEPLSVLITVVGTYFAVQGMLNLLDGYGNNIPAAQILGEQQLRMARGLVFLAAYIREGALPPSETMEYLAAH